MGRARECQVKVVCAHCHRVVAVKESGLLVKHYYPQGGFVCPRSNTALEDKDCTYTEDTIVPKAPSLCANPRCEHRRIDHPGGGKCRVCPYCNSWTVNMSGEDDDNQEEAREEDKSQERPSWPPKIETK